MAPCTLVGPPQITLPTLPTKATKTTKEEATKTKKNKPSYHGTTYTDSDSDTDSEYDPNPYGVAPYPNMGFTTNNSATFLATGNPCLDFFFQVVPNTPSKSLQELVEKAWKHDPLITLKLICNLRAVRGTGKSDKQGFYTAALWLHEKHPKTLALNMKDISGFGYFKDMPEILFRILEGAEVRKKNSQKRKNEARMAYPHRRFRGMRIGEVVEEEESEKKVVRSKEEKENARLLRLQRKNERARRVLDKYSKDGEFQLLYDSVSDHFGNLLKKDIDNLNSGDKYQIGFAAKWCPTLDSTYDEVTLLCESIARRVFPKEEFEEYKEVEEAHYAFKIRDRLRKEVLVPLRKALELPEVYMCTNKWDALPYNRVPSVAMKLYRTLFYKHDAERFGGYLEKVKEGKATIAAGAILPHEIIATLNQADGQEVAELQWKRMVDDIAKKGKLNNCMAICDVSGSMYGEPMEVSVALGLLISELSNAPWKGKLITFSADPQFHIIQGKTLLDKTDFIRRMEWGMSTNFQKVFDRILEVAVKGKIPEEQMIKRLFVFSDMEFDQASHTNQWQTDYMEIQRKFAVAGYMDVPEIVFWNLRHSKATPVPSNQPGVALVSGFSKNLVTLFLEEGGIINPESVMLAAIAKPEYDSLVVYD